MTEPIKLTGMLLALLSVKPGEDLAFNRWHDEDHIPMNRALPGIYHAQRYYAPAAYRALRSPIPPGAIAYNGGAYCQIYYFEGAVEQCRDAMTQLAQDLWKVNRMFLGARAVWSANFHLLGAHVRPGHILSPGAVAVAPHRGIFVSIREVLDPPFAEELAAWDAQTHLPDVLTVPGFYATYRLRAVSAEGHPLLLNVSYLDADPVQAVQDLRAQVPRWQAEGRWLEPQGRSRLFFTSPYQPITPGHYDFIGT